LAVLGVVYLQEEFHPADVKTIIIFVKKILIETKAGKKFD